MSTKPRRSAEDEQFWRNEKEPAERWPTTRAPRNGTVANDDARERLSYFAPPPMECCGSPRCVCICPDCGDKSIAGLKCDVCVGAHDRAVMREREESFNGAANLLEQLRMAGAL